MVCEVSVGGIMLPTILKKRHFVLVLLKFRTQKIFTMITTVTKNLKVCELDGTNEIKIILF